MLNELLRKEYKLYLIYSKWELEVIKDFMLDFFPDVNDPEFIKKYPGFVSKYVTPDIKIKDGAYKPLPYIVNAFIGPMRIDYFNGNESVRTLCLLHQSVYERLYKEGFYKIIFKYDFRIQPYEIRANNFPADGFSSNFYIPLPTALNKEACRYNLQEKMQALERYNLVYPNSYKITLPVISRKTGESTGSAFIEFNNSIDLQSKAILRLILNDTDWEIANFTQYRVKCLWARDRESRKKTGSASIHSRKNSYNTGKNNVTGSNSQTMPTMPARIISPPAKTIPTIPTNPTNTTSSSRSAIYKKKFEELRPGYYVLKDSKKEADKEEVRKDIYSEKFGDGKTVLTVTISSSPNSSREF